MLYFVYGLVDTRASHQYEGVVRYVGQTMDVQRRVRAYRKGKGNNPRHTAWINACPDFLVKILATVETREEALELEKKLIEQYCTYRSDHGLNAHVGGAWSWSGPCFSLREPRPESWKKAISVALTGRSFSETHRMAISQAATNKVLSEEHRRNIGNSLRGKPKTVEHSTRVSAALKNNHTVISKLSAMGKNKSDTHRANLSKVASAKRWQCDECDVRSNAGAIGQHQKATGHVGKHRTESS